MNNIQDPNIRKDYDCERLEIHSELISRNKECALNYAKGLSESKIVDKAMIGVFITKVNIAMIECEKRYLAKDPLV